MNNSTHSNNRMSLWSADFILLNLSALMFFTSFYLLLSTLPQYAKRVAGGDVALGFIIGSFAISALFFRPITGWALDRPGRKWFVVLGAIVFVVAAALYWFARSLPSLIAVRIFHGAGMALFTTAATTIVADLTPPARRGEAMGIFGVAQYPPIAIGPPLGALILVNSGFPWLFAASAMMAMVAVALAIPVRDRPFVHHHHTTRPRGIHGFLSVEVILPALAVFAIMITYGPLISFLPVYTRPELAGLYFTVYAVAISLVRAVAGRVSDIHGRRMVIIPGMALIVVSMIILSRGNSVPWLVASAVVYAAGMGSAQPALYALAVDMVSERRRGVALGTFTAALELGIGGGSILAGFISNATNYGMMFMTIGIVSAVGMVIFLIGDRRTNAA